MDHRPQPIEMSWAPEGPGLGPYHSRRAPQQANPSRTPPQAHPDKLGPGVFVPLPDTDTEMWAMPVPGWDKFVASYLAIKKTGEHHGPIECPDDIIHPKQTFGQQPPLPTIPGEPPSTSTKRPRVFVYAPGCTPGPAAAGVDPLGVWYDAPHDACPVQSNHRHDWSGGVHFPDYSHIDTGYDRMMLARDRYLVKVDMRCAEVAGRYLAALKRVGILPGPLLYLFLVPGPESLDGGGGGMWRSPHVPTPLASFASVMEGSGLLGLPPAASTDTGDRSRDSGGGGLDSSRRAVGAEPELRLWKVASG